MSVNYLIGKKKKRWGEIYRDHSPTSLEIETLGTEISGCL